MYTSTVAFDNAQFFPSLNHQLLSLILDKMDFDHKVSKFFNNYLVNRKTKYLWNNFSSPFYNIDIRVGQELALSSILSALYLSPIFHILENCLKNLSLFSHLLTIDFLFLRTNCYPFPTQIFFVVTMLFHLSLPNLVMEHNKTEVFHFFRSHRVFTPPLLDLSSLGGPCLLSKTT